MTPKLFNQCLERIRNGDKFGLEPIYYSYYEKMVLTALSKVKNREDAKDIASDFLKYILENSHKIGRIENPDAWIFQSIRNRAIDYVRKENRTIKITDFDKKEFEESSDFDLHILFTDAFHSLTASEQELILLHYIYGYKYREIARELNLTVSAIKNRILTIKQHFKHLKKYL